MPLRPDPSRAGAALARLDGLRAAVAAAEDDVLACLVVTGEPRPQRVLDDWLDQVADTLRAAGEAAADLAPVIGRYAVAPSDAVAASAVGAAPDAVAAPDVMAAPGAVASLDAVVVQVSGGRSGVGGIGAGEDPPPERLGSPSRHDHRDRT